MNTGSEFQQIALVSYLAPIAQQAASIAKFRLAYAIGLLTKSTRDTINLIKLIRNAFAHASNPISFDVPEITDACHLIEIPIALPPTVSGSENPKIPVSENRQKYQKACDIISHNLLVVGGAYVSLTGTRPPESV